MSASLLLAAALATATPETYASADTSLAAAKIAESATTGTLIFSKGDCLAVKVFTKSPYTHVATVVRGDDGELLVYDSQNGVGVRKQSLEAYCAAQCPDVMHVFHPAHAFSSLKARAYVAHLESQLGRPYGVTHHVTGERAEGIHCAEYVTDALCACEMLQAKKLARVSPASLREGVEVHGLYLPAVTVEVNRPPEVVAKGDSWCSQLWIDTKQCTKNCFGKMGRWFLCR